MLLNTAASLVPMCWGKAMEKKTNLVKCLVCGAVFDASLETCPVCGVGREQFVPYEEAAPVFHNDTNEIYLILGGGAAALNAAKAIRERDDTGTIVMVSEENALPYNRPMLTKGLSSDLSAEGLAIEPESWFESNRVFPILGKAVTAVNTADREVTLSSGEKLAYTKLIYALGSHCFVPPFTGSDLPGIVAIRSLADVQTAQQDMQHSKKAVVIGGGVLGLEAAWELHRAGMDVTVLEHGSRLMPRQLNPEASAFLTEAAEKAGVKIRTGMDVTAVEGSEHVTAVDTSEGLRFEAQLVIVSAGVRANVSVAKDMGLAVERAVVVDKQMKAADNIWACGDCAELDGVNRSNWPQAVEQGRVAGANAAGDSLTFEWDRMGLSFAGFNTALYAVGDNSHQPGRLYKTLEVKDEENGHYRRLSFMNDRLIGVVLLGNVAAMQSLTDALAEGHTYQQVLTQDILF